MRFWWKKVCFGAIRGKYLSDFGNTPGHLNHWSKRGFLHLLSNTGFNLISIECPLPWMMVLGKFKR
jgi:hypothetical protein